MRFVHRNLSTAIASKATLFGWVRTKRSAKTVHFLELVDGSALKGIQCVIPRSANEISGSSACVGVSGGVPMGSKTGELSRNSTGTAGKMDNSNQIIDMGKDPTESIGNARLDHLMADVTVGCSVQVTGSWQQSQGREQSVEFHVSDLKVHGICDIQVI
jgi:aspartyl/asparaginyl-tRNA synthetase